MHKIIFSLVFIVFLATDGPIWAHHSLGGFDRTKTVSLKGTVKQFKWSNPHAWLEMDVPDGNGGSAIWNVEMPSPVVLIRAGWKSSVIKPGDKVTVVAHPQQSGEPGGLFISLTLPDGRTLTDKPPATDASRGNLPRAVLTMPSSELWVWIQQDRRARYLERRSLLDELGLSFRT